MEKHNDAYLDLLEQKLENARNELKRVQSLFANTTKDQYHLYGTIQGYTDAIETYKNMKAKGEDYDKLA